MYDSILIPTDGSERSRRAAAHGISLAATYGATVHALNVIDTGALEIGDFTNLAQVHEALETQGEAATGAIAELAAVHDLDTVSAVRDGTPARTILRYAEEEDVDLVSMGTHGRTGLRRTLLGSVTERVVRKAERPVLTAHPGEEEPDTDYDRILVATDGGPESRAAARAAIDFAARVDAEVVAFSVIDTTITRESAFVNALEGNSHDAVRRVADEAAERDVAVETAVREGSPAEGIVDYAEDHRIDFVVMGTHGRTGLDRFLTSSVAERVIRHAEMPVLTVRGDVVEPLEEAADTEE
ncbi:universal stress protein [Halorientalis marina]|jgi:nucleotide-binding universal stress UspA family protein|uniref:universal stress protein n=1 Tax=Halorientalis marina TaxID=2931976 RepID=UPI001FF4BADE|nr:universal stress protein [Halorientalis marina]